MDGTGNTDKGWAHVVAIRGLGLLALAITGCSTSPIDSDVGYPASFPRLARPVGICPDFGGSFSNRGERVNPVSGSVEPALLGRDALQLPYLFGDANVLSFTFEGATVPGLFSPIHVNILHIVADNGMGWRSPSDRSICNNGIFQYIVKESAGSSPIGFGLSSDTIIFAGALDGSLIVKQGHQDLGILLVAPYKFTSGVSYYRFPLVPSTTTRPP